jgi:AcrR family transcriptional regulator
MSEPAAVQAPRGIISRRKEILDAVVNVVAERGMAGTSVGLVLLRARVSRRTFYECFAGLDDCLVEVMERTLERVGVLASRAFEEESLWEDGMRRALAAVLGFFDSEPALARVCLVETLGGGPVVLVQRERVVGAFRTLVVERIDETVSHASPLAAEGMLASVMGVVRARLIARDPQPLVGLVGPLMGIIAGLFASTDEAQIAREIERGDELARTIVAERRARAPLARAAADAGVEIPAALRDPRAHRVRLCLCYVAEQGGRGAGLSNSEVGAGAGVSHRGQLAALLAQLLDMGLLVKHAGGPGYPNAWRVTLRGEAVAHALERDG